MHMQTTQQRQRRIGRRFLEGVESNARLTGTLAAVLLVLLAAEGITILRIRQLINLHVFIGMLLLPPVLLKIGTTTWRFLRYYAGSPAYRRKGPPVTILRLLGPVVVVLTVILLGSGVGVIAAPSSMRNILLQLHRASFVLWFGAMAIHVLGHLKETRHLAPLDYMNRTRRQIRGAGARTWSVAVTLVLGVILGIVTYGHNGGFAIYGLHHVGFGH